MSLSLPTAELQAARGLASLLPAWLQGRGDLPLRWRSAPGRNVAEYPLQGAAALQARIKVALPITFTPYAATQPCSARCVFCSENLRTVGSGRHASQLRPNSDYFVKLRVALHALSAVPMGLSLSGLEMTDRPDWFLPLLDELAGHERVAQPFAEKILYSNGAGFGEPGSRRTLVEAIRDFGLQRIEWSRHSHEQAQNDRIMRFRETARIADNSCFEEAVREVGAHTPVTLVCIVQRGGISSLADVCAYLAWADSVGVQSVVFREFARTGEQYRFNNTLGVLQQARFPIDALVRDLFDGEPALRTDFATQAITEGYYFWNIECRWRERLRVVFEASDYSRMHALHASDTAYKLVFHANGHLTADWDPETRVLLKA